MVIDGLFGITSDPEQLVVNPFIPVNIAQRFFQQQSELTVNNVQWRGKQMNFTYHLPSGFQHEHTPFVFAAGPADSRVLKVQKVTLAGQDLSVSTLVGATIPVALLQSTNQVDVYLGITQGDVGITKVDGLPSSNNPKHFAPVEPELTVTTSKEHQLLQFVLLYPQDPISHLHHCQNRGKHLHLGHQAHPHP